MEAAQYLRKSRMEEGMETEEVLARHRVALAEYANRNGIRIAGTYCEVASGESLYARPEMLRLLADVEDGRYEAVLCMDLDRLSRGRMTDQGLILDAFRDSGTLIITPEKTYDLSDDLDDELAEFKTFLSRREYKLINKRLRRGLVQSIRDGCYVSNAPYGYRRSAADRRPTLEPLEPEAGFVRLMFRLYAQGLGCAVIARQLNLLGARPRRSGEFSRNAVAAILRNPAYIGKVVWGRRRKSRKYGTRSRPPETWLVTKGLHPPLVPEPLFDRVQEILDGKARPARRDGTVKNPLAGLVRCRNCGGYLQRLLMKGGPYLLCPTPGCCAGVRLDLVERRLLQHLRDEWSGLTAAAAWAESSDPYRAQTAEHLLAAVRRSKTEAAGRENRLYDLLEQGTYDQETFRVRLSRLREQQALLQRQEESLRSDLSERGTAVSHAGPDHAVSFPDCYAAADAAGRNALLRSVIGVIWYRKEKKSKPAQFELEIRLKPF